MRLSRFLVVAAALLSGAAFAQTVGYAPKTTPIRAGVLLVRNNAGLLLPSGAPHIWSIVDRDNSIKPADWRFDTPFGTSILTNDAASRWGGSAGQSIDKSYAPYWEVDLRNTTEESLERFDVLSLSVTGPSVITPDEREKLRLFIDKGGVLWVDLAVPGTAGFDSVNNLPSPVSIVNSGAAMALNALHPLALAPNRLALYDLYAMSDPASSLAVNPYSFGASPIGQLLRGTQQDGLRLDPMATSGTSAVIATAQFGNGFLVVTTRGISRKVNRSAIPGNLNNNAIKVVDAAKDVPYQAGMKLVVNMLSLSSRFASRDGGSRNANSTQVNIAAPAIKRFNAPAIGGTPGSPVLFNGRMIVKAGGTIYVYDADPNNDVDRDGNVDDGLPDPVGTPYDRIWSSQNLGTISDVTAIEVPNSPITEQLWVTSSDGRAHGFNLSQTTFLNVAPFASIDAPTAVGPVTRTYAPTYHEGVLYIADAIGNIGRLWMINPRMAAFGEGNASRNVDDDGAVAGTYTWSMTGASRYRGPGASPAVAYIPIQDGSGGLDKVAYIATNRVTGAGAAPVSLVSIWLGARAEVPTQVNRVSQNLNLQTRAASQNLRISLIQGDRAPFGFNFRVLDPNGNVFTDAQMATYFTGTLLQPSNGTVQVQIQPGMTTAYDWDGQNTPTDPTDDVSYRLDYAVDFTSGATGADSYVRTFIEVMDETGNPQLDLAAPPAVAESGNIGLIVRRANGGSFYNLVEHGRSDFWVRTRFEFHSAINNLGAIGATAPYPPAIVDQDDLVLLLPFLNQPLSNLQPVGISAQGDSFFVSAVGSKQIGPFGIPTGILISFEADPDPIEFIIATGSGDTNLLFKQPDMARSGYSSVPALFSTLPGSLFSIEPVAGSTNLKRVSINSLSSSTRGPMNSALANNLPVIVNQNGTTDTIYEPEAPVDNAPFFRGRSGGKYSHLNWYTVINGYNLQQGPVVAGQTVYIAGTSVLPALMNGEPPTRFDGLMFAMDARVAPDDKHLVSTAARPWVSQLYSLKYAPDPGDPVIPPPFSFNKVTPADAIKWPQWRGIRSFDDARVRILQAALLGEDTFYGLAAGEGAVAVVSEDFNTLFKRSDILVVDASRISRFDPAGNPIWSAEATTYSGFNQPGIASRVRRMSTPSKAYPDGANGYVFADPGNNIVVRMDAAGQEIRSIDSIRLHPDVTPINDPLRPERAPNGQGNNESKLLRNPQDVTFWTSYVSGADADRLFPSEGNGHANERWDHWLIADAGNNRVIEVVDRYRLDSVGRVAGVVRYRDFADNEGDGFTPALGMLWWHSPEEFSGKRYAYNSIARTVIDTGSGPREAVAFGFNNVQPSRQTFGLDTGSTAPGPQTDNSTGYGGVVIYDGPQTKVINEFWVPAIPNGSLMSDLGGGNYAFDPGQGARIEQAYKVSNLTSVSVRYIDVGAGPVLTVMLSTDRGVFEVWERPDPAGPVGATRWEVRWMLPTEAYVNMRRSSLTATTFTLADLSLNSLRFRPMHARRLDSGDVLIVNGYTGTTRGGAEFNGEVVLVNGNFASGTDIRQPGYDVNRINLGFNSLSILFELPPVQGIRGIVRPVFAERQ